MYDLRFVFFLLDFLFFVLLFFPPFLVGLPIGELNPLLFGVEYLLLLDDLEGTENGLLGECEKLLGDLFACAILFKSINVDGIGLKLKLSVNSTNSGEGNESIKADYNSNDVTISFNSKYLIDIASEIEDKNLKLNLKDSTSPVLIEDLSDKNSFYVIMPMKIWF